MKTLGFHDLTTSLEHLESDSAVEGHDKCTGRLLTEDVDGRATMREDELDVVGCPLFGPFAGRSLEHDAEVEQSDGLRPAHMIEHTHLCLAVPITARTDLVGNDSTVDEHGRRGVGRMWQELAPAPSQRQLLLHIHHRCHRRRERQST